MVFIRIVLLFFLSIFVLTSCVSTKNAVQSNNINPTIITNNTKIENKNQANSVVLMEPKEITIPEKLKSSTKEAGFDLTLEDQIVFLAKENIGVRYLSGGTSAAGMDCSGMVFRTFKNAEIKVPRSSKELANYGITISKSKAKPGDLIFFKTNGRTVINHVGIITEVIGEEIKFVHASVHGGVMINSLNDAYYKKAYAKINRVIE
jgi:cell wall-associated NlpC family hydrolase